MIAVFFSTSAFADDQKSYNSPDTTKQSMYSRGMPVDMMYDAAVQTALQSVNSKDFSKVAQCVKQFVDLDNNREVMDLVLATHPGLYFVSTKASLYESKEGQQVLFYCGNLIKKISPTLIKNVKGTADQYFKLAKRLQVASAK